MSYYYCEHCKDYKKKYHDCYKSSKSYDKYDRYYEKCDKKHEEKPWVNVKVDCCSEKKENVRSSAFRALNDTPQNITPNTVVRLLFGDEEFDLANEYDPVNFVFIPKKRGVYFINATVTFGTVTVNRSAAVFIRVNGIQRLMGDNEFNGPVGLANAVSVSGILQLNAGDRVDVVVSSTVQTFVARNNPDNSTFTHFEAARFPSPAE